MLYVADSRACIPNFLLISEIPGTEAETANVFFSRELLQGELEPIAPQGQPDMGTHRSLPHEHRGRSLGTTQILVIRCAGRTCSYRTSQYVEYSEKYFCIACKKCIFRD